MFSKTTRIKLDLPGRTAERFVTLRRAPEPSDIWWENTRDYAWAIVRRRTFAVLGYVVLLAAAFAVQFVLGLRAEAERVERIESGSSASDVRHPPVSVTTAALAMPPCRRRHLRRPYALGCADQHGVFRGASAQPRLSCWQGALHLHLLLSGLRPHPGHLQLRASHYVHRQRGRHRDQAVYFQPYELLHRSHRRRDCARRQRGRRAGERLVRALL